MTHALKMAVVGLVVAGLAASSFAQSSHWPQFRGVGARGISAKAAPTAWDMEKGENVRWKTPIPGLGHSCPVVWGDKLFVTSAVSSKGRDDLVVGLYGNIQPVQDDSVHTWHVYCLDRNNGKILWDKVAHEGVPAIKRHTKATHANSTAATDGKHVVAFFGSEGLHCFDMNGKLLWKKDLGRLDAGFYMVPAAQWEFGSSPIIHGDKVIVQCDVQKNSFLAAFDVKTGKEIWRTKRTDVPTWSTPTVHLSDGRKQVIVNGFRHAGGYDLETGAELWKLSRGGDIPVPTPIVGHDLIYITNAHGMLAPLYAIRTSAVGDVSLAPDQSTNDHIAWSYWRRGIYMQTPLLLGDYLYCCRDNGVLSCYNAKTGEAQYKKRLGSGSTGFTASPVAAGDHVYFTSEQGDVYILKAGSEFKLVGTQSVGEVCMATPAVVDGTLFFRTQKHVIAIGE